MTGNIEIHPLLAPHHNLLLEPYVQALAQTLKLCIDRVTTISHLPID